MRFSTSRSRRMRIAVWVAMRLSLRNRKWRSIATAVARSVHHRSTINRLIKVILLWDLLFSPLFMASAKTSATWRAFKPQNRPLINLWKAKMFQETTLVVITIKLEVLCQTILPPKTCFCSNISSKPRSYIPYCKLIWIGPSTSKEMAQSAQTWRRKKSCWISPSLFCIP